MSESSKSSELLFELCDDDLDSDDEVARHEEEVRKKDAATRCVRTWRMEQDVVWGRNGMGMESHNTKERRLHATQEQWLPALLDQQAIEQRGMEIVKVPYAEKSVEAFVRDNVQAGTHGVPFIAEGAAQAEEWPALEKWEDKATFLEQYPDVPLHITEIFPLSSEFGKAQMIRLPAALYLAYSADNDVDFPFYPFERDFDSETAVEEGRAALLGDFSVPKYFRDDLYAVSAETRAHFLKHKFVLIGGYRTGACMHQDPMGTCAWNTLIAGKKRWVFFPPDTPPHVIMSGDDGEEVDSGSTEGVYTMSKTSGKGPAPWWIDVYPKLVAKQAGGKSLAEKYGMVEVLQTADQTIYTPPYWFHAVLNVTPFTIAATGNVLTPAMLAKQWPYYKKTYPDASETLRAAAVDGGLLVEGDLPL